MNHVKLDNKETVDWNFEEDHCRTVYPLEFAKNKWKKLSSRDPLDARTDPWLCAKKPQVVNTWYQHLDPSALCNIPGQQDNCCVAESPLFVTNNPLDNSQVKETGGFLVYFFPRAECLCDEAFVSFVVFEVDHMLKSCDFLLAPRHKWCRVLVPYGDSKSHASHKTLMPQTIN